MDYDDSLTLAVQQKSLKNRVPSSLFSGQSLTTPNYCSSKNNSDFSSLDFNKEYPFSNWQNSLEKDEEGKLIFHKGCL